MIAVGRFICLIGNVAYHDVRRSWWYWLFTFGLLAVGAVNQVGPVVAIALMALAFTMVTLVTALIRVLIFYYRSIHLPKRRAHILSLPRKEQALEIIYQFSRW